MWKRNSSILIFALTIAACGTEGDVIDPIDATEDSLGAQSANPEAMAACSDLADEDACELTIAGTCELGPDGGGELACALPPLPAPPAAVDACANAMADDACAFEDDVKGTVEGTCQAPEGEQLACAPEGPGPGLPSVDQIKACDGAAVKADCSVTRSGKCMDRWDELACVLPLPGTVPPQEAVCFGAELEDQCKFILAGTCQGPDGMRACAPEGVEPEEGRGPPPAALDACYGEEAGAACEFMLDGHCQVPDDAPVGSPLGCAPPLDE